MNLAIPKQFHSTIPRQRHPEIEGDCRRYLKGKLRDSLR